MPQKKNIITLKNINPEEVEKKYNIQTPKNTTRISDIIKNDSDKIFCFLDELKNPHKCPISSPLKSTVCFWDRNSFDTSPIGCPIRYIPEYRNEIITSEITNSKQIIREPSKENQQGYYETDGVFCSFNCCLAYIKENKHNPLYRDSLFLLKRLYLSIFNCDEFKILPAASWRVLKEYGGHLDIETYRKNFNRIEYDDTGIMLRKIPMQAPVSLVYDEKIIL